MALMTISRFEQFRGQLDAMYSDLESHQSCLEHESPEYWKIQDYKAAIADLMNMA